MVRLTKREREALLAAASGLTALVAAKSLGISDRTYRRHLTEAAAKLGANGVMNAVAIAASSGVITVLPERKPPCYDGSPAGTPRRWRMARNTLADDQLARQNGK